MVLCYRGGSRLVWAGASCCDDHVEVATRGGGGAPRRRQTFFEIKLGILGYQTVLSERVRGYKKEAYWAYHFFPSILYSF